MTTIYKRFPTPIFRTQYSIFLDGMQYAKGRYAVREHPIISYPDINFYCKNVDFASRNTTNVTYKVK